MGAYFLFECQSCDYKAEISGGEDSGIVKMTETMTCKDCQDLVDVLIGTQGEVGKTDTPDTNDLIGVCPKCNGKNISPWSKDGQCPKCGGLMIQGELVALWD